MPNMDTKFGNNNHGVQAARHIRNSNINISNTFPNVDPEDGKIQRVVCLPLYAKQTNRMPSIARLYDATDW